MLVGTADPGQMATGAPRLPNLKPEPLTLEGVEIFQALFEMRVGAREALVPPGLHPTNPPTLALLAWRAAESPWGPFSLVQARVGCRSGVRTRGLVVGCACDLADAGEAFATRWGFPVRPAEISLRRGYDAIALRVEEHGSTTLDLEALRPVPLDPGDVQYTGTLTLAHTPRGLRLIQVEPRCSLERAERVTPRLGGFDAASWGDARLSPYHPVSASIATGRVEIPPLRFVCRPDVMAFEGTESVVG